MKHTHKAKTERVIGWTHCVAARGDCGIAHGGVVFEAACSCGARRWVESTGRGREASSGWLIPEPLVRGR